MGLCSRAWFALMRRNAIYRKRYWLSTALEILLPLLFVYILVAIKGAVERGDNFESKLINATFPIMAYTPFSFADYLTAIRSQKVCLVYNKSAENEYADYYENGGDGNYDDDGSDDDEYTISGIAYQGDNWPVPFVKCDARRCEQVYGSDGHGQNATTFCQYMILALAPSTETDDGGLERVLQFESYVKDRYPILSDQGAFPFPHDLIQLFKSSEDMAEYVTDRNYGTSEKPKIAIGIVFEGNDENNIKYSLRQNSTNFNAPEAEGRPATATTPDTSKTVDSFGRNDNSVCTPEGGTPDQGYFQNSCTGQYMYNGVLTMQRLVGDFILNVTGAADAGYKVAQSGVQFTPFPTRPYKDEGFYSTIEELGPIVLVLGLLYPVANMISYIAKEKELRQKELMKMMSVTESDIGWSWFMTFMSLHFFTSIFAALLSSVLYENSSVGLLWFFWLFTMINIVVFSMAVATITSKSTRAVLIGLLIFFAGVFLTLAVGYDDGSKAVVQLISLHPMAVFSYGLKQIGQLEEVGVGLTTDSVSFNENKSGYSFQNTVRMLLFDGVFWGFLAWYLNRVIRPDFGRALPIWFPFSHQYWCPSRANPPTSDTAVADKLSASEIPYEPVGDNLKRQTAEGKSIEIHDLCKVFKEKQAVDHLNLSMYEGQVTALLGHNGAGKTTTINMLTGAMDSSDGYATVAGRDIRTDMQAIRQDIGICLQHDCLFPDLTVSEHVRFFSRIKGLYKKSSSSEADAQVDQAIRDVALFEKRNSLSKSLSGGMRRKLSVAIAFCGGSKVVLLDEPTSGMDPFSRRFTWNVIRRYRQDRCIILTTHFMDEADILGDRIAIMSEGQLRCAGTSLFLKKTYGVGYQLTIEKSRGTKGSGTTGNESATDNGDEEKIEEAPMDDEVDTTFENPSKPIEDSNAGPTDLKRLVKAAVPESMLLNDVGTEIRYQLPLGASSQFAAMFESLDKEVSQGRVSSYGVSMTTLDEVFLLVARGDHREDQKSRLASSRVINGGPLIGDDERSVRSRMDLEKDGLFLRHMGALFKKRAANFKRDKKAWLCTTVLPSLFVLMGFLVFKFAAPERNLQPLTLDLSSLNPDVEKEPVNPISVNDPSNSFQCQPAICYYQDPIVNVAETGELYSFCGVQANLGSDLTVDDPGAQDSNCVVNDASVLGFCGAFPPQNESMAAIAAGGPSCTTENSFDVIATLHGYDGATAVGLKTGRVVSSSIGLNATSANYTASQYGAIWFTHEPGSVATFDFSQFDFSDADLGSVTTSILAQFNISDAVEFDFSDAVEAQCLSNTNGVNYTSDCESFQGYGYIVQYNFTALHASPLFQALADQALARFGTSKSELKITATIAPLPITRIEKGFGEAENAFTAWFLVVLSFPFIAGAFATFVVLERQSKAKHLQTVAGVQPAAYWFSTFLWDTMNYQIPLWLTVIMMFIFKINVLTTSERDVFSGIVAALFFFGPAAAGFSYCVTFAFNSASLCNIVIIISGFLIGMGGPMTVFILTLLGANPYDPRENLETAAAVITWILRFIPSFCLGKSLFYAINIETFTFLEEDPDLSVWHKSVLLIDVIYLIFEGIIYTGLAVLLDQWSTNPNFMSFWNGLASILTFRFLCPNKEPDITTALPEDEDVLAEQNRVVGGEANEDLIVISQMSKIFGNGKIAVNNMSLGIPHGECFGLLGINGAGKTTTMGVLTAEFPPSTGDATLAGFSVTKEPQMIRRRIGYCPQFDAHFANMTGREHVELYASIKGVPRQFVKEAASSKLEEVGLSEYDSDRLCANYSGGMKRRLSLACATIGQPQLVFLDECSTGVDPVARREIWQLVSDMVSGNVPKEERTSVVLTTHSMEECEALCPRIGIMANGRLRCLGSAQHLKDKFGQGFQVEMKTKITDPADEDYISNARALAYTKLGRSGDDEEAPLPTGEDVFFTYDEAVVALRGLTEDDFLSSMVDMRNPYGYSIWKGTPVGVALNDLAVFATDEMRVRKIEQFLRDDFPNNVFRERQDQKVRYEVSNEGVRISTLFAAIEAKKDELLLSDYGVSQTSLEQVFNRHAEIAEKLKQGRDDEAQTVHLGTRIERIVAKNVFGPFVGWALRP